MEKNEVKYAHMPPYQAFTPTNKVRARKIEEHLIPYRGESLLIVYCRFESENLIGESFAVVPGIVTKLREFDGTDYVSSVRRIVDKDQRSEIREMLRKKGLEGILFLRK